MVDLTEPLWLRLARTYIGEKEIPGQRHNTIILSWLSELKAWWKDDETPWCGVFVAHCMRYCQIPLPTHWYRAKGWQNWGLNIPKGKVTMGAVLVFERPGGGHVGFYAGEDATRYFVLGGNQGNQVSIVPIDKSRCVSIRWPVGVPLSGGPKKLASKAASSTNEG